MEKVLPFAVGKGGAAIQSWLFIQFLLYNGKLHGQNTCLLLIKVYLKDVR